MRNILKIRLWIDIISIAFSPLAFAMGLYLGYVIAFHKAMEALPK